MTALEPVPTHTVVDTGLDRRRAERQDYGLFAKLRHGGTAGDVSVWVVDLSSRGATLLAAHDVEQDAVTLELHLGEHPVHLPVMIRNRRIVPEYESRPGPFYRYGVSFAPRLQPAECAEALLALQ
jgi:hypothetical protein